VRGQFEGVEAGLAEQVLALLQEEVEVLLRVEGEFDVVVLEVQADLMTD